MRTTSIFILVACLTIGFSLLSCTKENDSMPEQDQIQIEDILKSGTWKITRFEDAGKDETSHFSGYNFIFGSNSTLTADNGMNRLTGSWSIFDQSSDDDSLNDLDFILHFNESDDFEELNEDWDFVSYSQNLVELIHLSGGNGGTDYLTFERK